MKTISICGSSRNKGNTAELLRTLDKSMKDAKIPGLKGKKITLSDLDIKPCRACLKCKKKGSCVISDDFGKIITQILHSDLIILGSPVYFSDVSSSVKTLMDRTLSLWHTKQLKGKKIILAAACAESGTEHTIETMKNWAKAHEMELISTIEGKGEKKGSVLQDEKAMERVKTSVEQVIKSLTPAS